jgi:hypothetical protein
MESHFASEENDDTKSEKSFNSYDDDKNMNEIINTTPVKKKSKTIVNPFKCPICNETFRRETFLNEHFGNMHLNSYTEMNVLDKKNKVSYPSLDILESINMITYLSNEEIKEIHNTNCTICLYHYTKIELNNKFTHYSSQLISCLHQEYNEYLELENEDEDDYEQNNKNNIYAIKTSCCKNNICINCLKMNIICTQQIVCPFCNLDFSITEKIYIQEIIPEKMNKSVWINWWKNHMEIFY